MRFRRLLRLRAFVGGALEQHLTMQERQLIWQAVAQGRLEASSQLADEEGTTVTDRLVHALRPKELQLLHWLWAAPSRDNPEARHYMRSLMNAVHDETRPLPLVWRLALMRDSIPPFQGGGDKPPDMVLEDEERAYVARALPKYTPSSASGFFRHQEGEQEEQEPQPPKPSATTSSSISTSAEDKAGNAAISDDDVAHLLSGISLPWLEDEEAWREARERAYRGAQEGSRQIVRDVVAPIAKQKLFERARAGAKLGVKAGVEEGARKGALQGAHEGILQGMEQGLGEQDVLEALTEGAWAGASESATKKPMQEDTPPLRCMGGCPQCEDRRCSNDAKIFLTYNPNPNAYHKKPIQVEQLQPQFRAWLAPLLAHDWERISKTDSRGMVALCSYCHQLIMRNLRMYYPARA